MLKCLPALFSLNWCQVMMRDLINSLELSNRFQTLLFNDELYVEYQEVWPDEDELVEITKKIKRQFMETVSQMQWSAIFMANKSSKYQASTSLLTLSSTSIHLFAINFPLLACAFKFISPWQNYKSRNSANRTTRALNWEMEWVRIKIG